MATFTTAEMLDRATTLWEEAPNTNNERAATLLAAARELGISGRDAERAADLQRKVEARRVFLRRWSRR